MQDRLADSGEGTAYRPDDGDLSMLMPSSKRAKDSPHDDVGLGSNDKRYRTSESHASSLYRHSGRREGDRKTRTERHKDQDGERTSSKKKRSKEKKTEEMTRETNWLSSNLRVRIVDQKYKMGKFYNTKVINGAAQSFI